MTVDRNQRRAEAGRQAIARRPVRFQTSVPALDRPGVAKNAHALLPGQILTTLLSGLLGRVALPRHASPELVLVRRIVEETGRRLPQGGILNPPFRSFAIVGCLRNGFRRTVKALRITM
ncbi:hypothetical protein [Paraburkholderia sp. JHI869]|uniref:hypothetical protein n=1 Tax=Paraburkholderia sp. JHI869 TaxID=3112959 RepID=UPI00316F6083